MLPRLRIILAAVIATCAAVLTLSAGLVGARDPARNLGGVPDLSRSLVRQAIVEQPEWRQSEVLAYSSRRADELLRLRDLPVTPVRAVVEYAEQAQARAAASAPAAPPAAPTAAPPADSITVAPTAPSEPAPTIVATAPAATPPADAPREPAAESPAAAAVPPADTPPPPETPTIAIAPAANPPIDTTTTVAAAPVATPPAATPSVSAPPSLPAIEVPVVAAPADTAAEPPANAAPTTAAPASAPASGDTQVAAVQTGPSETAEMYGPVQPEMYGPVRPSAEAKPHHGGKTVHARPSKPKKKPQVAHATSSIPPTTSTGYPVDQPSKRPNNPFGWQHSSNEGTTR